MLPHIGAMAFFSASSLDLSYGFAQRFAGKGGHIATLPEIVTARTKHPEASYLWRNWFTSSSSEYFGYSRGGAPIIIVAHGVGPMVGITGIEEAYQPKKFRGNGMANGNGEGHISLDDFRLLESGHYGDVAIIEVSRVLDVYPYPFMSAADMSQAERDPLLQARLGPDWQAALKIMLEEGRRENVRYSGAAPKLVQNDGPMVYRHAWAAENWPLAHLLSTGAASRVHASPNDGGEYIGFDVGCHQRWHSKRFIGVRPGGDAAKTHPGPSKLYNHTEQLLLPNPLPAGETGFFVLKQFGNQWFTQARKDGAGIDTGWPEYPVVELEVVGPTGKIVALDQTMFFHYDIDEVIRQAPKEANAYYVSSEPQRTRVGGRDAIVAEVVFCRVVLDESRKAPAKDVLDNDYDLQIQLMCRLESAELAL
jgi:hypothetical protein